MHELGCYLRLALAYVRGQLSWHRYSTILFAFGLGCAYCAKFGVLWIIIDRFKSINGWEIGDLVLIYSINATSLGIANLFFMPFRRISSMIESGDLDRFLLRPVNPLISIAGSGVELAGISGCVVGVALLGVFAEEIPVVWEYWQIGMLLCVLISGSLVHASILLAIGSCSFLIVRTTGIDELYSSMRDLGYYPITIYHAVVQLVLLLVVPVAFANFVPAGVFLSNETYRALPEAIWIAGSLFGFIMFGMSSTIWRKALRAYQGTGH